MEVTRLTQANGEYHEQENSVVRSKFKGKRYLETEKFTEKYPANPHPLNCTVGIFFRQS